MADNNMFKDYPDVVTVEQLSEMLHIGKNSAYNLIHTNQIQHIRIGKHIKIAKTSIITFLMQNNI